MYERAHPRAKRPRRRTPNSRDGRRNRRAETNIRGLPLRPRLQLLAQQSLVHNPLAALHQALAHGPNRGLGAIADGDLAQNVLHVLLDRLDADLQRLADLLVAQARGQRGAALASRAGSAGTSSSSKHLADLHGRRRFSSVRRAGWAIRPPPRPGSCRSMFSRAEPFRT